MLVNEEMQIGVQSLRESGMLKLRVDVPYLLRVKTGEKFYMEKPVLRIGRAPGFVDWCIRDNCTISRIHAKILLREDSWYIADENSMNYTYINGKRCSPNQPAILKQGDQVKLADECFEVYL